MAAMAAAPRTLTLIHFNDTYEIEARDFEPVGGAARLVSWVPAGCPRGSRATPPSALHCRCAARRIPSALAPALRPAPQATKIKSFGPEALVLFSGDAFHPRCRSLAQPCAPSPLLSRCACCRRLPHAAPSPPAHLSLLSPVCSLLSTVTDGKQMVEVLNACGVHVACEDVLRLWLSRRHLPASCCCLLLPPPTMPLACPIASPPRRRRQPRSGESCTAQHGGRHAQRATCAARGRRAVAERRRHRQTSRSLITACSLSSLPGAQDGGLEEFEERAKECSFPW